jgi:hypothetical protein
MTSQDVIKAKAIKAILEAIEEDDEDDAKVALKMIRVLLGEARQS